MYGPGGLADGSLGRAEAGTPPHDAFNHGQAETLEDGGIDGEGALPVGPFQFGLRHGAPVDDWPTLGLE